MRLFFTLIFIPTVLSLSIARFYWPFPDSKRDLRAPSTKDKGKRELDLALGELNHGDADASSPVIEDDAVSYEARTIANIKNFKDFFRPKISKRIIIQDEQTMNCYAYGREREGLDCDRCGYSIRGILRDMLRYMRSRIWGSCSSCCD